ncbi:ATP-binding cassette sub-family F member 3-like [Stegodyphus dumicola]|uniref:ATP-binding cassette sub-family F member 3-like n=1 Tax=Stegodyphus dumicola TaxID=202533 RepID=UPI0015AC315B|nr:ATP-binding cassette sub-family F member 3-like [Stegodyphus dumicola]
MALTEANSILVTAFPSIDTELYTYIESVLDENKNEFESSDHIYEAIGEMLHEVAGGSKDENEIKDICSQLLRALKSESCEEEKCKGNKILSAPVCLGSLAENFENEAEEVTSIWLKQRESASFVDQRKLEKAEARLKSKQEKRDNNEKPISGGAIINKEATAVQASSKKESRMELKGSNKSMDIKIENFDIAFGDK